jgi:hypothetical protein
LSCEYKRIFEKTQTSVVGMVLSGAWRKMIHGKNLKQNISWHCSFKAVLRIRTEYFYLESEGQPLLS